MSYNSNYITNVKLRPRDVTGNYAVNMDCLVILGDSTEYVSPSPHPRTETGPVSETLYFLTYKIDEG
jgi:hypothetical protein